jgi:hypothetical protein
MNTLSRSADAKSLRERLISIGFAHVTCALDADVVGRLRAEATKRRVTALRAHGDADVPYRAHVAAMGAKARRLLSSAAMRRFLDDVFEAPLELSPDASCYTYYAMGDHLGLHRDRPDACIATMILYLDVRTVGPRQPPTPGMCLRVFGTEKPAPTEAPTAIIPTEAGTLVVGWGAKVWHQRLPLGPGESVAALTMCFRRRRASR